MHLLSCRGGLCHFGKKVENSLNKSLRELFILGYDEKMVLVMDDDKMYYQVKKRDIGCPKTRQHVKDNRKGFIDNQLVFPALQICIGAKFQEQGSTTHSTAMTLIKSQCYPTGADENMNMFNASFNFDRGYSQSWRLIKSILEHGGDIDCSTAMRIGWFPYTCGQKKKSEKDK
jgi:hypothetical protein